METLQHDSRTKLQIKDMLYSFLYEPVQKKFDSQLNSLIQRNTLITKSNHNSFMYKGQFYSNDKAPVPRVIARLTSELAPEMDQYLKDLKDLNTKELPYVVGFINQVLNASNDLQDYLRILPDSLHPPIQKFIQSCPCRNHNLSEEDVETIQAKNQIPIELVKKRMVINLLI